MVNLNLINQSIVIRENYLWDIEYRILLNEHRKKIPKNRKRGNNPHKTGERIINIIAIIYYLIIY